MAKAKRKRRTFTLEEKQSILSEVEAGNKLVDVAKKYEMQPAQLSQWKSKYGKGGAKKGTKASGRKAKSAESKKPAASASRASASRTSTPRTAANPAASRKSAAPRATTISGVSVAELERMIGRLTVENIMLRRQLEELGGK